MQKSRLSSKKIVETIGLLKIRIEERFGASSLARVCGNLRQIGKEADRTIEDIQQGHFGYRFIVFAFVALVLAFSALGLSRLDIRLRDMTVTEMLPLLDALFNIVFLVGGAIIFLVSMENRAKRRKVIKAVNILRCLAHVVDAQQLTKDPCYVHEKVIRTSHSPERNMDAFQLSRYLDYCSEMLSLISKVAFLYVQDYNDPAATNSVKDLEDLTNGLSRKIWQKIMNIKMTAPQSRPDH
jgi:hypothetical protein